MEFQHNHKFEKSIVIFFPKVGKLLEKQYNKANKMQQWEIIGRYVTGQNLGNNCVSCNAILRNFLESHKQESLKGIPTQAQVWEIIL